MNKWIRKILIWTNPRADTPKHISKLLHQSVRVNPSQQMNNLWYRHTRKMKKIYLAKHITLITEYKHVKWSMMWSKWFKIWFSNKVTVLKDRTIVQWIKTDTEGSKWEIWPHTQQRGNIFKQTSYKVQNFHTSPVLQTILLVLE